MNAKNNVEPDWNLILLSCLLSLAIFLNYFFWSINAYKFFKFINFFSLLVFLFYFVGSKKFKDYTYVKLFIFCLLILCLGSVTVDWDARSVWGFHAKRIFFDNNLYAGFDHYMPELMNAYPLLPASLTATLAQIVGHWNEIYPKSTNILILLPALLIQCSFLKNNKSILFWLMLILLFSGRILVNGLMDGLVAMYFVTNCIIIYNLFFENYLNYGKNINEINKRKMLLFYTGIFCGIILSLLKNEGFALLLILLIITILFKIFLKKPFTKKEIFYWILIMTPIIIWKFLTLHNGVYPRILGVGISEALVGTNSLERIILRLGEIENYKLTLDRLLLNEKFIFSVLIFTFSIYKNFKNYKLIYIFVTANALLYYILLYLVYFSTPHDLSWHLNSSHRVIITIVMILSFFSIYLYPKKNR